MQHHLYALLPRGETSIEKAFPEVGRIADVVWEEEHIVFEVQCSPISVEEIQRRNNDYASIGYRVVWLLDMRRFCKKKLSASEIFLQDHVHYRFSLAAYGRGAIYDSCYIAIGGIRHVLISGALVDITKPVALDAATKAPYAATPKSLRRRITMWSLCFSGGLASTFVIGDEQHITVFGRNISLIEDLIIREHRKSLPEKAAAIIKKTFFAAVVRPYTIAFRMLLERCCR